jgi:hypothetical protein
METQVLFRRQVIVQHWLLKDQAVLLMVAALWLIPFLFRPSSLFTFFIAVSQLKI